MKTLRELQDSFQRGILAGDDAILGEVNDSSKEQRKVLESLVRTEAYVDAEALADMSVDTATLMPELPERA